VERPTLTSGARFGPYRLEERIGAGGMGEVFRAFDTRLERAVALKVLAPDLVSDPEFRARFEREGRLLASLNHPHIAAIHGLETAGEVSALVLELVEGPTLAERLRSGRLRPEDAIRTACQVAAGLEAAHDKGIVHRDLKPANVKIAADGSVKILDFGIAKTMGTQSLAVTATGTGGMAGTPAYMSPEQMRADTVDKRADIWAFGCLLYELLAGRAAFAAATMAETMARVMERDPDWAALPDGLPASIRTLLRRCLQKDPADRLHDIADARLELADALSGPHGSAPASSGVSRRERLWWIAAVAIVSVIAAAAWLGSRRAGRSDAAGPYFEIPLRFPPDERPSTGISVSPDGHYIAASLYARIPRIWLTVVQDSTSAPLAGTEGGGQPFWSGDGSEIGFYRAGKLLRIARSGGPVREICDAPGFLAGTWNTSGVVVFAAGRSLMQVPASGGTPAPVGLALEPEVTLVNAPQFLPDDRHFLFRANATGTGSWRIGALDSDRTVDVLRVRSAVRFAAPDSLLFVRGTALVAQTLDMQAFRPVGPERVVAPNVLSGNIAQTPSFSASRTALAFVTPFAGEPGRLTWFDQAGARQDSIPSPSEGEYLNPSISPDGSQVALNAREPQTGNWDVWIWNRPRAVATKLTENPANDTDAVWSPDGTQVVFSSTRDGRVGLYRRSSDGSGSDELVANVGGDLVVVSDWSTDGRYILYATPFTSPPSVWALPLKGERKPIRLLETASSPYSPRLSPDGRWLAYSDVSTGSLEVHLKPFMRDGPHVPISQGGGMHPRWIRNGNGLTYAKIGGGIAAVDLELGPSAVRVGPERVIMPLPVGTLNDNRSHYDITRDGRQLLVRQPAGAPGAPVTVVVNWAQRLK